MFLKILFDCLIFIAKIQIILYFVLRILVFIIINNDNNVNVFNFKINKQSSIKFKTTF